MKYEQKRSASWLGRTFRRIALVLALTMTISALSGCFWLKKPDSDGKSKRTEQITDRTEQPTEETTTTESTQPPIPTAYDQNLTYLYQQGLRLPRLDPEEEITIGQLLSVLTATYEFIGGEIDLPHMNPSLEESESVSKMRFLEVYKKNVVKLVWVKGDNNKPLKERCDELAFAASLKHNLK